MTAGSFELLDARGSLRLVTDAVHEDDALCLTLTCRTLRDTLWARFPWRSAGGLHTGARVCMRDVAAVGTVGRLAWERGLDQPWPGPRDHLGSHVPHQICETAARCGALASLQWAWANGWERLQTWANGNVHCGGGGRAPSSLCCNRRGPTAVTGMRTRAVWRRGVHGHLAVLQWARANGCGWSALTCSRATGSGHLALLQWLRANGCDWSASTCSMAALGGHLARCSSGCGRTTAPGVGAAGSETCEWIQAQPA
jgi:hypothetical protein